MIDIVNGLLLRDGCVLMALRSKNRKSYPNTWSFPGGHVEQNESLDAALSRELTEEIGVCPTQQFILTRIHVDATESKRAVTFHLYAIESWKGEPVNLGDEHNELRWVSYADADNIPNLALKEYRDVFATLRVSKSIHS